MSRLGAALRLLVTLAALGYTGIVVAVLLFARFVWLLDLLTFAWPHVLFAGVAVLAAAIAFRVRFAILLAVAGVLLALVPFWQVPVAPADTGQRALRVLTANLYVDNAWSPEAFVNYVRQEDADIVVLDEVRPQWADAVSATGIYPYESSKDLRSRDDKKVFSKFPILSETPLIDVRIGAFKRRSPVRFEIDHNGRPLTLYAIHPETPRRRWQWRDRNAYLAVVSADAGSRSGDIIAAGDWNTPQWSPFFRDTLNAAKLKTTAQDWWPPATRFSLKLWPTFRLGVAIDHVAVSDGFVVAGWRMGPDIGSNHFPVTVDLIER